MDGAPGVLLPTRRDEAAMNWAPACAAEQGDADEGRGDGPEERGLAVDFEEQAEAGKTALGGEGDGPGR